MKLRVAVPFALLTLILGLSAQAQVPVLAGKPWQQLNPQQHATLAPLAEQWPQMDAASRDTWIGQAGAGVS